MQKLVKNQIDISSSSELCLIYFLHSLSEFLKHANCHFLLNTCLLKALNSLQLAKQRMTQGTQAGKKKSRAEATEIQALEQLISLKHLS